MQYDVCLSFAGEDRKYVRAVADVLSERGVRVFYDEYAQADLWGKDLYTHLDDIYRNAARYCVLFASKAYAKRVWTNHERESAQARALEQHREYTLPARFDGTPIPGLRPTIGHISLTGVSPKQLAELVVTKIGDRPKSNYFPPVPDRLFEHARAKTSRTKDRVESAARHFFEALGRTAADERTVVLNTFLQTCSAELPENVHVSIDLMRRLTGFSEARIIRLASGLRSLGVYAKVRDGDEHDDFLGTGRTLVLEWHDLSTRGSETNATKIALQMLEAASDSYCASCSIPLLQRLDFSQLASATHQVHHHGPTKKKRIAKPKGRQRPAPPSPSRTD
jgi:hypothetical protein